MSTLAVQQSRGRPRSRLFEIAHRISGRMEPRVADAFLRAIRRLESRIDEVALLSALASRNLRTIEAAVRAGELGVLLTTSGMTDLFQRTAVGTGQANAEVLSDVLGIEFSFRAIDPNAVMFARQQAAQLVVEITEDLREAIRIVVATGAQIGLTTAQQATAIREIVGLPSIWADAPTKFNMELATGKPDLSRLLHDPRLPPRGREMMRRRVEREIREGIEAGKHLDDKWRAKQVHRYAENLRSRRALNIARTECLPAETFVDGAVVRAAFRRWYSGDMIQVRTAGGREFSATPNHPMLTRRGWVPTKDIRPSDYLVCHTGEKNSGSARHEDVQTGPSALGQVFDSLAAVGFVERERTGQPDFHGDGADGEVDIAHTLGFLRVGNFSALGKPALQHLLAPSDVVGARFCDCERLLPSDETMGSLPAPQVDALFPQNAPDRYGGHVELIGDLGECFAPGVEFTNSIFGQICDRVVGSLSLMPELGGLATAPVHARIGHNIRHPSPSCPHFLSDPVIRESAGVKLDRVISVGVRVFRGHVYNLQTSDGYFNIANGLCTGNSIRSANFGQRESWRQARRDNVLPETATRHWVVTPDDRLRETHAAVPGMNPDGVPIDGGVYDTPLGPSSGPPLETNCRCSEGLTFPGLEGIL